MLNLNKIALNFSSIEVIRKVCCEIKKSSNHIKYKDNQLIQTFLKKCRKYQTIDEQTCKVKQEAHFLAETYLTYLESTRKYQEIIIKYSGKHERSISETAKLVGLKLPNKCLK